MANYKGRTIKKVSYLNRDAENSPFIEHLAKLNPKAKISKKVPSTEYTQASFVNNPFTGNEKELILTQCPFDTSIHVNTSIFQWGNKEMRNYKRKELSTFWQLIWSKNVYLIIMMCSVLDQSRLDKKMSSCENYIPMNISEKKYFGDTNESDYVETISVDPLGDYFQIRKLRIFRQVEFQVRGRIVLHISPKLNYAKKKYKKTQLLFNEDFTYLESQGLSEDEIAREMARLAHKIEVLRSDKIKGAYRPVVLHDNDQYMKSSALAGMYFAMQELKKLRENGGTMQSVLPFSNFGLARNLMEQVNGAFKVKRTYSLMVKWIGYIAKNIFEEKKLKKLQGI